MAALTHLGYFPFCAKTSEDDAPDPQTVADFFPFLMTLPELMAAFYQVKTWRFTTWSGSVDITARSFGEYQEQEPFELSYALGKEREPYLIVLSYLNGEPVPPFSVSFFNTGSPTATIEQPKVNFIMFGGQMYYPTAESALATGAFFLDQPFIKGTGANEGFFRPQFIVYGLSSRFSFSDPYFTVEDVEFSFASGLDFIIGTDIIPAGSVTLTFSGKTFTKQLYTAVPFSSSPDDDPRYQAAVAAANEAAIAQIIEDSECTIEAIEYWPYDQ